MYLMQSPHLPTSHAPQHVALSYLLFKQSPSFSTTLQQQQEETIITKMPVATKIPHTQYPYDSYEGGMKHHLQSNSPSTGQILAVVTLLPVTGTLLGLAGIILVGTLIGLAVATPLFVIFSPILIPAAILISGTVTAFLTSGVFGLTGLSSLSWVVNMFRQATGSEPMDYAKRRMQDAAVGAGERTRQAGEMIKSKAQTEGGREVSTAVTTVRP